MLSLPSLGLAMFLNEILKILPNAKHLEMLDKM